MSFKELEQLGNLLLSNVEANVLLALTILEKQPELFQKILPQALVYYFFTYQSPAHYLQQLLQGKGQPLFFMTQEGREIEPRFLIKEWLEELLGDFEEEQHCLYPLSHYNLDAFKIKNTTTASPLPSIQHLQQDLEELTLYTPYIDYQATWTSCYHKYAHYLKYLLQGEEAQALPSLQLWEYQKVLLEYLRKAQQQHPQDHKIALSISTLLHQESPSELVAKEYAQEVIDNYLIAAFIPDPSQPLILYTASAAYTDLANFYRDILQQALSAHYYYNKSLELAPSYDQAKIEWAALLKKEGAYQKAQALLERVDVHNL